MRKNRTLYRTLLILSFLVINAAIVAGVSSILSYMNTGADRSTILHLPEAETPNYVPKVTWTPLANEGRPISSHTLSELERDYLKAWYVRNIALETNDRYGIADYYTDSARVQLYDILDLNTQNNAHFKGTTLSHHPTLEFYSADGKIAVLTDTNVERHEEAYINQKQIAQRTEIASYQVMLLLEDGFWRIRHLVKLPSQEVEKAEVSKPDTQAIPKIKGVNYYPQKYPWDMFGATFTDSIIVADFTKIKQMELNTVRIFVPYATFGKAQIEAEELRQLRRTLDIAEQKDLKVILTLFDFYGDYSLRDWTLTHRHADQIVNSVKDHNALLAWDVKNEPDLDFETRGKTQVTAWLRRMITEVKSWDNQHPVTIGWSSPEAAKNLAKEVDFVSFHYYREPAQFVNAFQELKSLVPDKPLVLQEYGYSSYDGIWNAYLGSEENQADYIGQMQKLLDSEDIPFVIWTLYDFESVPNSVVGKLPWRKVRQQHFGLLDSGGQPKEAFSRLIEKK